LEVFVRKSDWWGTLGFVAREGPGFALTTGLYLYLAHLALEWPIAPP
jgi:cytochrome c oxidase subunit 3